VVDDLASRALVLNLSAHGAGLGEWLTSAAGFGAPFYVTLHQLVTLPVVVRRPVVYVCENPAVLRRAAAELGGRSAPLVCTEGRPSTAFHPPRRDDAVHRPRRLRGSSRRPLIADLRSQ
jgi:hypothetical protein